MNKILLLEFLKFFIENFIEKLIKNIIDQFNSLVKIFYADDDLDKEVKEESILA